MLRIMIDLLLARARLAIEESRAARLRRRLLMAQHHGARNKLRCTILESAMVRSEVKAYREDRPIGPLRRSRKDAS